tara:strand:+ start:1669 stop:2070 length:402 start_codon:yes stop_codon:yes gene_type:complete
MQINHHIEVLLMIKFKLFYLAVVLIIFSVDSYAIKIINQIKKDEIQIIESFQDYKEYRIEQLNKLKQLGIINDKFIESELKILKTFEENETSIKFIRDGSRINALMCFDFNENFIEDFEKINKHNQELICKIN